jgi:chitin disaccharide deacetylase
MPDVGTAPRPGARDVAICVDDFGLHEGVNQAVLGLAERRRISTVSCMVGAPAWPAGSLLLRRLDPHAVDVGLHFDLTEHPCDSGLRHGLARWYALGSIGAVNRSKVRAEFRAQLDRFEQALGRAPAHVDGHQHVHQFPVIRDVVLDVLVQRYAASLPWVRSTRRSPEVQGLDKAWLIERLGCEALARAAQAHGFAQNRSLLGVYDFEGTADAYLVRMAQWLERAQAGDLIMCHPARAAAAPDAILPARLREYEVLAGAAFGRLLAQQRVRIAPLSRLERPTAA